MSSRKMTATEICEIHAREFHGDEWWKKMKTVYDDAMAYRKTLKGKPTDEQRAILENNARDIELLGSVLWHSTKMADYGRCVCTKCGQARKADGSK